MNLAEAYIRQDQPQAAVRYALMFHFSKNQNKTIEFLQKQVASADDFKVWQAVQQALQLSLISGEEKEETVRFARMEQKKATAVVVLVTFGFYIPPGVISHDFHKKEALYNEYLQQVQRQRERGWQVQKGWLREAVVNEPAVFRVAVLTRNGEAVSGATVAGKFLRPSSRQQDIAFDLIERTAGIYEAELKLPLAGQWNLVLRIQKGEDLHEIRALTKVLDRQVADP